MIIKNDIKIAGLRPFAMMPLNESQLKVQKSLLLFLGKECPKADLTIVDHVVMLYVITLLDTVTQDSQFELDSFIEIMSAYVPDFAKINPPVIYGWMLGLEAVLRTDFIMNPKEHEDPVCRTWRVFATEENAHWRFCSPWSHSGEFGIAHHNMQYKRVEYIVHCQMLREMFPQAESEEIKHCVNVSDGNVKRAAATLLYRDKYGPESSSASLDCTNPKGAVQRDLNKKLFARYHNNENNAA